MNLTLTQRLALETLFKRRDDVAAQITAVLAEAGIVADQVENLNLVTGEVILKDELDKSE